MLSSNVMPAFAAPAGQPQAPARPSVAKTRQVVALRGAQFASSAISSTSSGSSSKTFLATLGVIAGLAARASGSQSNRAHRRGSRRAAGPKLAAGRVQLRAMGAAVPGSSLSLFSPAKINLFLRIVGRRPDGYHDLASLFHTVSLGDTLDMEVLPEGATQDELECNLPGVPTDASNLVIRALNVFRERSGLQVFFRLNLQKNTPAQAGMGGGSSNAATAFYGANALCGFPASPEELLKWSEDPVMGSDASFFLSDGTAYCTGRGEIVEPVGPLPVPADQPLYLVKPKYGLSTPKVFKAMDLAQLSTTRPEDLLDTFRQSGVEHSSWVNDLEKPAFTVCPDLGQLKQFLEEVGGFGFKAVLMSGSGTTIYCVGDPAGGRTAFEEAVRGRFDIEGIWRTNLVRRSGAADAWYGVPEPENATDKA